LLPGEREETAGNEGREGEVSERVGGKVGEDAGDEVVVLDDASAWVAEEGGLRKEGAF
jgi:hypothetical protein